MKPKFRDDVFFAPTADGVQLRNERGPLNLRGPGLYDWVERLSRLLDGSRTLDELTAGLGDERARYLRELTGRLAAAGFVKDRSADRRHGLSETELLRFAPEIAFVDAYRDSAAARFEAFRNTRTLLIGAGPLLVAAAAAAARTGLRTVDLAVTDESGTDLDALEQAASVARVSGDPTDLIRRHGLVLTVTDRPMPARARRIDRFCHERGIAVGHLLVADDEAWISAPADGTRWEDGWLRLRDQHGRSGVLADAPGTPVSAWLTGPTVAVAANQLVFSAFAALTGVHESVDQGELTALDLRTLETGTHRFDPHPLRLGTPERGTPERGEPELTERIRALAGGPALDPAEFSERAAGLFEPRTGIAADLDEGALRQLPLHLCTATVADPVGGLLGTGRARPSVLGSGPDLPSARAASARAALEVYGDLIAWAATAGRAGWAWEAGGKARRLTAAEAPWVWPAPATAYRRPAGLASGLDWPSALAAAVADAYVPEALARATGTTRVDLDRAELDAEGARLLKLLRLAEVPVCVWEATGPLAAPVYLAAPSAAGPVVAACAAETAAQALKAVLERVLISHQLRVSGSDELPAPSLPTPPSNGRYTVPDASARWDLTAVLRDAGRAPLAIPLDHDPVVAAVLPYLVRVVIADV